MAEKAFERAWYGASEPTIGEKLKSIFKNDKEPLSKRAVMANYRVRSALNRVRSYIDRINERDKELFERAVESLMRKDEARAKIYVNEVAEIRKIARQLLTVEYVLEHASIRLDTFMIVGEAFTTVAPVVGILKEAANILRGIAPDLWIDLNMAVSDLSTVMSAAGFDVGLGTEITMSPEAKKIFEEARIVAEQRLRERFPELPATAFAVGEQAGIQQGKQ